LACFFFVSLSLGLSFNPSVLTFLTVTGGVDPLGALGGSSSAPLLSSLASASTPTPDSSTPTGSPATKENDGFVPWSAKKSGILAKYTTNESIPMHVVSSFSLFFFFFARYFCHDA
jgi:hypothetical protein